VPLQSVPGGVVPHRTGRVRSLLVAITCSALLVGTARAQDGPVDELPFDSTGPDAPPQRIDAPMTLWSAETMNRGRSRFSALAEGAGGLLLLQSEDGDPTAAVSLAAGLAVSGGFALADRIEIGASASLWRIEPSGRFAAGAVRVEAPVSVLSADDAPLAVGITPWFGVPVGSARAGVASPGLSGGLVAAARVPVGPVDLNGNLGVSTRGRQPFPGPDVGPATQSIGGPSVDFGAAVGWRPGGGWRADLELRGAWSMAAGTEPRVPDEVPEANVFAEALATGGGPLVRRDDGGLGWRAGLGTGLTQGIGTSLVRGFLALTWTDGVDLRAGGDDGSVDRRWTVVVVGRLPGQEPAPLADASVRIGTRDLGRTDSEGRLDVVGLEALVRPDDPDDTAPSRRVAVDAPGWEGARVLLPEDPLVQRGARILSVELDVAPRAVPTRVTDASGTPIEAVVRATSEGREPVEVGADALALYPGQWALTFQAEGYGEQTRTVRVPFATPPEPVSVVLRPVEGGSALVHTVRDAEGNPVAGATVLIDGLPVGVTGEDGTIAIEGLAEGDHELVVDHPGFAPTAAQVTLGEGTVEVESGVDRVPGTVRVVAVDGSGAPVRDAVVRFAGPRRLAPMPLGEDGVRSEVLGEGTWTLLVSSVEFGFQQRQVVVPPDRYEPLDVRVVMRPDEGGEARLEIRVVEPGGMPVEGAQIALDGEPYGTTSSGGVLVLQGLTAGQRELQVSGEGHVAIAPVPVVLIDGLQEEVVTLPWEPGSVRVTARTPSGPVTDASVRFAGPASIAPMPLGRSGRTTLQLEPGDWSVLVTSPEHGIQQRQVSILDTPGPLIEVDVVLNTAEGGLASLGLDVRDPEGFPVSGASVFLDSVPLGTTSNGTLRADSLAVGKRELEVESTYFRPWSQSIQLMEDEQEVVAALEWAPGAVQVRVRDADGEPVTDGVVRLLGQRAVPPTPVGADGKAMFSLEPGEWQALAISPTLGMTQVNVLVEEDPEEGDLTEGLQVVDITLVPVEKGLADVVLRVVDDGGTPITGAEVSVDDESRGTTPPGGALALRNLLPGTSVFTATAPGYAPTTAEIEVVEGSQVRYIELSPLPGQLAVVVTGPDGKPVDAEIALVGPEDWLPTNTGRDGRYTFHIRPGEWRVVAKARGLGAASRTATVSSEQQVSVDIQLAESRVRVDRTGVVLEDVVLFDFNADTLRAEANPVLDEVASTLQANLEVVAVEIRGHTDDRGDLPYNLALSQRRAETVRRALVERGVPPEILTARGYGASRPVKPNDTEAGRAANRRVEFVLGD
jgi:outer membrane protein OmpA-like peptidoglycan-associated protein